MAVGRSLGLGARAAAWPGWKTEFRYNRQEFILLGFQEAQG